MRTYRLLSQTAPNRIWHNLLYKVSAKPDIRAEFYTERKGTTKFPNKALAEDKILQELVESHVRTCSRSMLITKIQTEVTIH